LKKKCEQTDLALITLAEERNNYKSQSDTLKGQKKRLEDLCRSLQTERTQLRQEVEKLKGISGTTNSQADPNANNNTPSQNSGENTSVEGKEVPNSNK